nr:hypothetical protein [Tanacetum cinerariifolium]
MSDSEDSTVTYTTVSSPYVVRSGDVSPGEDGPPALPAPNYVPGPEEPEQAPPSPVYMPYVPEPVYPEYIPVEDEVFPAEEQPLPAAASPTTNSPGYIPESDPDEDPKDNDDEDPEEDPADYPTDHDDDDEEEEEAHSQHHPLSSPYHYHHPYSCYLLTVKLIDLRLPCHLERGITRDMRRERVQLLLPLDRLKVVRQTMDSL